MKKLMILAGFLLVSSPGFAEFNVDAEVGKYLATLSGEALEKSNSYFEGEHWIRLWSTLIGCLVAFLLMASGLSARTRFFSKKLIRFRFLQDAFYTSVYLVLSTLIALPFSFYTGYVREHQYGLSNLDLAGWFAETGKGLMLSIVLMSLFIPLLFKIMRRFPKNWWLGGTLASVAFLMFSMFIAPVFISPIFNKYQPLEDGPLKQDILSMAHSNGIEADNIYWFDASKQSKRISANVSGIFGTTRISLNDNLLKRTSPEEIMAVMGHEMGHYRLNHVYESLIYFSLLILIGFYFVHWFLNTQLLNLRKKWGVNSATDIAYLPVFFAAISVFFFFASPVSNSIIRSNEVEADIFGLNVARQPDGFAKTAMKLSEYRKISPGYWEEILFFDHPSGENRVHMSMVWKKENMDSIPKLKSQNPGSSTENKSQIQMDQ